MGKQLLVAVRSEVKTAAAPVSTPAQDEARAAAVAARDKATAAQTALDTKGKLLQADMKRYADEQDFDSAAAAKRSLEELVQECSITAQAAADAEAKAASMCVSGSVSQSRALGKEAPRASPKTVKVTCGDLFRTDVALSERVSLEKVRVLSIGKLCQVPTKGKGKDKGKSKGGKSGKAKGNGKAVSNTSDSSRQDALAIYCGENLSCFERCLPASIYILYVP